MLQSYDSLLSSCHGNYQIKNGIHQEVCQAAASQQNMKHAVLLCTQLMIVDAATVTVTVTMTVTVTVTVTVTMTFTGTVL